MFSTTCRSSVVLIENKHEFAIETNIVPTVMAILLTDLWLSIAKIIKGVQVELLL